jgi:hypothetical protein
LGMIYIGTMCITFIVERLWIAAPKYMLTSEGKMGNLASFTHQQW